MKKQKVEIDFFNSCSMDKDTGLAPGGRKWNMRFYRYNTHEMMGDSYIVTGIFLILISCAVQYGLFVILGWWWLWIQLFAAIVIIYFIVIESIKYKARINRFAIRMNKKYGVPIDQAKAYWTKNREYLS